MTAANQEISAELQLLAMKESRFRKGQTRVKGGSAPSGGGKRRVRLSACIFSKMSTFQSIIATHSMLAFAMRKVASYAL